MNAPPAGGLGGDPSGGPIGYYAPPGAVTAARPATILWFRVFCIVSALVGGGTFFFLAIWQFLPPSDGSATTDPAPYYILLVALPFVALNIVGACIPFKPWGWTIGLVVLGFGLFSCLVPFAMALLVFWTRPAVKAAFGRF